MSAQCLKDSAAEHIAHVSSDLRIPLFVHQASTLTARCFLQLSLRPQQSLLFSAVRLLRSSIYHAPNSPCHQRASERTLDRGHTRPPKANVLMVATVPQRPFRKQRSSLMSTTSYPYVFQSYAFFLILIRQSKARHTRLRPLVHW